MMIEEDSQNPLLRALVGLVKYLYVYPALMLWNHSGIPLLLAALARARDWLRRDETLKMP